jgi:hypothetical protein
MPIKAKITTRSLTAGVTANKVDASLMKRSVKANISINKIDAKVTTRNVAAKVTTNKVVAKVVTNEVVISTLGRQGIPGPPAKLTWITYAGNAKHTGVETIIASGKVLEYILDGATIYRFITDAFTGLYPSEDSFYSDFDGINLTNLLVTRGEAI